MRVDPRVRPPRCRPVARALQDRRRPGRLGSGWPRSRNRPDRTHRSRRPHLDRRQEYITDVHAEGVFSGHPDAQLLVHVHTTTLSWEGIEHILLCTDGFARAVGEYGLYPDWPTLVKRALDNSL